MQYISYCKSNSDIIPIPGINSFYFSFSKNEINQFSSSSIDKNQKVLFIKCEKGVKNPFAIYRNSSYCLLFLIFHLI